MGLCKYIRVLWIVKALWIVWSETINILRYLQFKTFLGCPRQFHHRFMHIYPSSGHSFVNLNVPFKLILRTFDVAFWYLEWECCTFQKIDENWFKSTNTKFTMALIRSKLDHYACYEQSELHVSVAIHPGGGATVACPF